MTSPSDDQTLVAAVMNDVDGEHQVTIIRVRPVLPPVLAVVMIPLMTRAVAEYRGDTCEFAM